MTILVTGGAGYVGSHAVKELQAQGIRCIVLDNLSRGHRELVLDSELIVGDVGDAALVGRIIREYGVSAVMHFAAYAYVGESVAEPLKYYSNNVAATAGLLRAMVDTDVGMLVFSSTCATYGLPETTPITEVHPQRPINPYGAGKLMVERMLQDVGRAHGLRTVVFRYFNAAGAHPSGAIGELHTPETHLIPLTLQAAAGLRDGVEIYGTDYPTPDGTCIRDYIHVADLARAHVQGLLYLQGGNPSQAFNLGNGKGFSVREVIEAVERVTRRAVKSITAPPRPGDPPALVGSSTKARTTLGWEPRFDTIDAIIETAWRWQCLRGVAGPGSGPEEVL
jgi:UDP-glucose 4-epimerase